MAEPRQPLSEELAVGGGRVLRIGDGLAADTELARGAQIIDCGGGAVLQALRPIAAVALSGAVQPGSTVTLDASGSAAACHAGIASYAWSVTQPATNPPPIQNASSARASIVAPAAPNTYTLMLTVTDDQGRSDSATVLVTSSSAQTSAPAAAGNNACLAAVAYSVPPPNIGNAAGGSGGGHGGGGALDLLTVLALAGCSLTAAAARRAMPGSASSQPRLERRAKLR